MTPGRLAARFPKGRTSLIRGVPLLLGLAPLAGCGGGSAEPARAEAAMATPVGARAELGEVGPVLAGRAEARTDARRAGPARAPDPAAWLEELLPFVSCFPQ